MNINILIFTAVEKGNELVVCYHVSSFQYEQRMKLTCAMIAKKSAFHLHELPSQIPS